MSLIRVSARRCSVLGRRWRRSPLYCGWVISIAPKLSRGDEPASLHVANDPVWLSLAIDELRELAHGIHPTVLARLGLAKSIESIAMRSSIPIELLELPSTPVDPAAEATAYYVVAEAVTNALKHACASSIQVRAAVTGHSVHVEVLDDGIGAGESAGYGLQSLRDRVEAMGGTFAVGSAPDRGTRVAADIPVTGAPA